MTYTTTHTPNGATRAIAERVARATGMAYTIEGTGGGCTVATWDTATGAVVTLTEEAMYVWATRAIWEGDGTEDCGIRVAVEGASPWQIAAHAAYALAPSDATARGVALATI